MKVDFKKLWLIFLTVFFLLIGIFVIFLSISKVTEDNSCSFAGERYVKGEEILEYKEGYVCTCEGDEVFCVKENKEIEAVGLDKFTKSNLTSKSKLSILGQNDVLNANNLYSKITAVSVGTSSIDITLEQQQMCTLDGRIPAQIPMYYFSNDSLLITNIVNTSPTLYTQECTVSITYSIKKLSISDINNLKVGFMNEKGEILKAVLCYYNSHAYSEGDIYSAIDNCNICKCENGISKCSNERVCTSK